MCAEVESLFRHDPCQNFGASFVFQGRGDYRDSFGEPEVVGITETYLDKSVAAVALCEYTQISRLDRRDGRKQSGIALYALSSIANSGTYWGLRRS